MTTRAKYELTAEDKTTAAFQSFENSLGNVDRALRTTLGTIGGVIGFAGFGALIHNATEAGAQVDYFSKQLNISTEALTRWQYAAERVGIGGEKIADIFKDVAEKIGDAYINGGGEAKDALDNLGLSAQELINLSPDKQLLAIAQGLDSVSSSAVRIQIMEALANDASRLLPLLNDNADALQKLMAESDAVGNTMTKAEAEGLKRFDDAMTSIGTSVEIAGRMIASELLPYVEKTDTFIKNNLNPTLYFMRDSLTALSIAAQGTGSQLWALFTFDFDGAKQAVKNMWAEFDKLKENWGKPTALGGDEQGGGLRIAISDGWSNWIKEDSNGQMELYNQQMVMLAEHQQRVRNTIALHNQLVANDERQAYFSRLSSTASLLGSLSQLVDGSSKRQADRAKALARFETGVSTYAAAQKAYESMSKFGPVAAGLAATAAVGAGLARLRQINSMSYSSGGGSIGGGGGGSVGTYSATPGTGFPTDANQQYLNQPAPATNHITIQLGDRTLAELVVEGNRIADRNDMQIFQTEAGFERVRVI